MQIRYKYGYTGLDMDNNLPDGDNPIPDKSWTEPKITHVGAPKSPIREIGEGFEKVGSTAPEIDLIHAKETKAYRKDDPPLIDLKVTNPVSYLKRWWKRMLANEGISLSLKIKPLTAIMLITSFALVFGGTGFGVAKVFFPNSSPILKREVLHQGKLIKSGRSFYLVLSNNETYRLEMPREIDGESMINQPVLLRGNLTREPNLINVKELNPF